MLTGILLLFVDYNRGARLSKSSMRKKSIDSINDYSVNSVSSNNNNSNSQNNNIKYQQIEDESDPNISLQTNHMKNKMNDSNI